MNNIKTFTEKYMGTRTEKRENELILLIPIGNVKSMENRARYEKRRQ